MAARSVCCLCGRSRAPPVNSCNRLARRVSMEEGERTLTRAAASSMASGRPSNRAQISVTADAFSRVSSKSGLAATARCRNSSTAGYWDRTSTESVDRGTGSASGGTGNSCSPYTCSAARLVTRILRLGPITSSSATVGAACTRCSKLSNRNSMGARHESCKFFLSVSSGDCPPSCRIPKV